MSETPQLVRDKVEATIDRVNFRWDLRLPHPYGARKNLDKCGSRQARKCSSFIRLLSFRPVNLDGLMDEFDLKARQLFSDWVWKPSQERGTLPTLPVTKSFIERDLRSSFKLGTVTDSQRQQLLEQLFQILSEECQLANESGDYSRTGGPNSVKDVSQSARSMSEEPQLKNHLTKSAKRSLGSSSKVNGLTLLS